MVPEFQLVSRNESSYVSAAQPSTRPKTTAKKNEARYCQICLGSKHWASGCREVAPANRDILVKIPEANFFNWPTQLRSQGPNLYQIGDRVPSTTDTIDSAASQNLSNNRSCQSQMLTTMRSILNIPATNKENQPRRPSKRLVSSRRPSPISYLQSDTIGFRCMCPTITF